jgi:Flp pilus assembly protein CpaB
MELTGKKYTGKKFTRRDWRAFLATRRGTVAVAAACALLAATILIVAMQHYRHSVSSEGNQDTVLVAGGLIQKGTSGEAIASEQLFKPTSIAAKQASAGAVADTAQLHGKVAAQDIYPGQQLTAAEFTVAGGLAGQLAPAQRAMTVPVDAAHGLVGQIHSGDHVDVYAGFELEPANGGRNRPVLRLLMSNIQVLKAGSESGGGLGSGQSQTNVTLNVNDAQAGPLAFAADNGKVWLVLRPANTTATAPSSIVTIQSLLLGSTAIPAGGKQ